MVTGAGLSGAEDGEAQAALSGEEHAAMTEQGNGSSHAASQTAIDNRHSTATDPHVDGPTASNDPTVSGRKRKSPGDSIEPSLSGTTAARSGPGVKKLRLAEEHAESDTQPRQSSSRPARLDRSLLPPEIWHHVFTFCPPRTLGSLLVVNKSFNSYLDPASPIRRNDAPSGPRGALAPMPANAIWQASRRLFWPQMPTPLRSKTELEMWQLACSTRCEECGRPHVQDQASSFDPRHPGPGTEGVAVIWAFGRRMCAACLLKTSDKEVDLLLSPTIPSAIIPALPFVFVTPDCDVFSATAFDQGQLPPDLQVTKLFPKSDVEALQAEFLQVRDMGQGTVSEWLKGLPGRGSHLRHDAAKWEKWESSGGILRMCSLLYPGYQKKIPVFLPQKPPTNGSHITLPAQGRHERTFEEAAALKAARKAEIERRASLLDPPLTPEVLHHVPAFQAATHIAAPLDDDAWERLKPRLLAQRADAEKIVHGERSAVSDLKQELQNQQHPETTLSAEKEARDRIDKNWEEVQAPLRAKIAGYADEAVGDVWGKGRKITKENCSRFAVDSLLYIRKRFYDEVAKEVAAAKAAGKPTPVDPLEGPFTLKLTLENMKWIFDTKIKPHTEPLRKELFYCNGCEGNFKTFGLEGVIQHYAAKHTSALSLGGIVVHWRAEWPEHPPFSAAPRPVKASFYPPAPIGFPGNVAAPLPVSYNYPPVATAPTPLPPTYPPPMAFGYTPPAYSDPYQLPPPLPHPPYQAQLGAPPFAPPTGYPPQPPYAGPPAPYPAYQPPAMPYPPPAAEVAPGYMAPPGAQFDYHYGGYQANTAGGPFALSQPPAYRDLYQTKVEDIARNSREVWRALGDIRDLPGSVRVFVTIHHLVKRFQSRFYETPPLSMFIDGLSNNKEMRPVRNVNGLVCKACHLGLGNAASVEQDRKDFSLPQLANHFQSKHIDPMQRAQPASAAPLDWTVDMVLVTNLERLPSLALSASEPQKALLSAAFPAAFAAPLAGPHTAGQSSHSTTSGQPSENDRSVHSDGHGYFSQGPQPHGGQNGVRNHKKAAGKNKREKPQDADGSADWTSGKTPKTDDRGKHTKDMRASNQNDTPFMHPSPARLERHETGLVGEGRAPTQPRTQSPHQLAKNGTPQSANAEQEPSLLAALESHLEQRHSAYFRGEQGAQDAAAYGSHRDSAPSPVFQTGYGTYTRASDRERRAWSPPVLEGRGRRSPGERQVQVDTVYPSRPETAERREYGYGFQRADPGSNEPLPRRLEDERFGFATLRPEDRGFGTLQPEAGYRRYHDDMRGAPRPPVEAYEIVHVIDESGEYYIRRPVRHEPDPPRYMYEDRRAMHHEYDAGPEPALEPAYGYGPVSRSSVARQGGRGSAVPEGRPADRRADPAYYEEYDPRFPAA